MPDSVNHPKHYNDHSSGIECIDVAEGVGFSVGNVLKYLWRFGRKGEGLEDLKKALWYTEREISYRQKIKDDPLFEDMSVGLMKFVVNAEKDPEVKELLRLAWHSVTESNAISTDSLKKLSSALTKAIESREPTILEG